MREAAGQDEFDGAKFVTAAKEFILLLRQHIFKENNILTAEDVIELGRTDTRPYSERNV